MWQKEMGLVPKGRHFVIPFLEMGGACSVAYRRECLLNEQTVVERKNIIG
jgi:hypothetical protein